MSGAPSSTTARELAWRWGPAVAWAGLIFVLSAQPGLTISTDASVDAPARHLAHMGFHAVLAALVVHGLNGLGRPVAGRTVLVAAVITVGFGITDEIHQSFVPERTAQLVDVGYDAIGAVAGVTVAWLWGRSRARRAGSGRAGDRAGLSS